MSNISVKLIKEIRERTGAGIMECKRSLISVDGDIEKAIKNMRILNQTKADKKASHVATEGVIEAYALDGTAVLLEINSETDFIVRDDSFKDFARKAVKAAHSVCANTIEKVLKARLPSGENVEEARKVLVAKTSENIQIRRVKTLQASNLGVYVHGGKIGVIVALEGGDEKLSKDIAMHVAASNPHYINPEDVPIDVVDKEKAIQVEIALHSGKPKAIAEKMVVGRMQKFTEEVSLTGQAFVKDPNIKVGKLIKEKGAKVISFIRLEI